MMNQYETVFILTPVLSDQQMKETVEKFKDVLTAEGAEINCKGHRSELSFVFVLCLNSRPLKTIFQHRVCTDKLYTDSFYKVQKNSRSSFEVICCGS